MSFTQDNLIDALRVYTGLKPKKRLFGLFVEEVANNYSSFDWLHKNLVDQESKDILSWAIRFRIVAYLSQSRDVAAHLVPSKISGAHWQKLLEQSKNLPEAEFEKNLDVDLIENFILHGYNLPNICSVSQSDIVLDFGGFNGNSAVSLGRHCPDGRVYVFEPNPGIQEALKRNLETSKLNNIEIVQSGVGEREEKIRFRRDGAASRIDPKGDVEVDVISIDNWVKKNELPSVDFMKFDIEGAEVPALRGAANTIRHFRPKMAISVYHMFNDFTVIPRLVRDLGGWYEFYLRHNAITGGEIVLYCKPS